MTHPSPTLPELASRVESLIAALDNFATVIGCRGVWLSLVTTHGLTPQPPAKVEPPLKYGAEIVTAKGSYGPVVRCGKFMLLGHVHGETRWSVIGGQEYSSRDTALSALNSAPPPPGWVEPEKVEPEECKHTVNEKKRTDWGGKSFSDCDKCGKPVEAVGRGPWKLSPTLPRDVTMDESKVESGDGMEERAAKRHSEWRYCDTITAVMCEFARSETSTLAARVRELEDENKRLAAALEKKLGAWSKDPRTVHLCRVMDAAGIRYDYESPVPPRVKKKPPTRRPKSKRGGR